MASLIPAIGTCLARMTGGERRFAQRLGRRWRPARRPISAGRHGPKPLIIKLPCIQEEADYIAKHLKEAHKTAPHGATWR